MCPQPLEAAATPPWLLQSRWRRPSARRARGRPGAARCRSPARASAVPSRGDDIRCSLRGAAVPARRSGGARTRCRGRATRRGRARAALLLRLVLCLWRWWWPHHHHHHHHRGCARCCCCCCCCGCCSPTRPRRRANHALREARRTPRRWPAIIGGEGAKPKQGVGGAAK